MAAKMLDEVLSKEHETMANEQAASEQADRIIDEAKQKVKQIELDALEQIQAYESEQLKLSEERRQKAVAEAEKDARAFVEVLKGKADAKFSETAKFIYKLAKFVFSEHIVVFYKVFCHNIFPLD